MSIHNESAKLESWHNWGTGIAVGGAVVALVSSIVLGVDWSQLTHTSHHIDAWGAGSVAATGTLTAIAAGSVALYARRRRSQMKDLPTSPPEMAKLAAPESPSMPTQTPPPASPKAGSDKRASDNSLEEFPASAEHPLPKVSKPHVMRPTPPPPQYSSEDFVSDINGIMDHLTTKSPTLGQIERAMPKERCQQFVNFIDALDRHTKNIEKIKQRNAQIDEDSGEIPENIPQLENNFKQEMFHTHRITNLKTREIQRHRNYAEFITLETAIRNKAKDHA